MKKTVYDIITDRLLTAVESGTNPFRKPWSGTGPQNLITKKNYRGINWLMTMSTRFTSPYWLSFKQANDLNGKIKAGSKGTPIVLWKFFKNVKEDGAETEETKGVMIKYYTIFNLEQTEGIKVPETATHDHQPIESAELLLKDYYDKNKGLSFGHGEKAYYAPGLDKIVLPEMKYFHTPEGFYSTYFHEAIHSTGHESRLDRLAGNHARFGNDAYSREELTAEIGAAMLDSFTGIESDIDNHASYLRSWSKHLRENTKELIFAAQKAQKAVDFIRDVQPEAMKGAQHV